MLPWKSRWSRVRFVKMPVRKRNPAVRPWARAWEETSITTWLHPAPSILARRACRV